jgi:hypothetical protein
VDLHRFALFSASWSLLRNALFDIAEMKQHSSQPFVSEETVATAVDCPSADIPREAGAVRLSNRPALLRQTKLEAAFASALCKPELSVPDSLSLLTGGRVLVQNVTGLSGRLKTACGLPYDVFMFSETWHSPEEQKSLDTFFACSRSDFSAVWSPPYLGISESYRRGCVIFARNGWRVEAPPDPLTLPEHEQSVLEAAPLLCIFTAICQSRD